MNLSCGMSQHQGFHQEQRQEQVLTNLYGESSGDIILYSLHRISRKLTNTPPLISQELVTILKRSLLRANTDYKSESGNNWNCLTSNNLVDAIEQVNEVVLKINDEAVEQVSKDHPVQASAIKQLFADKRQECTTLIQKWFEENYENLLYDTSGKVPWAVVQRLRKNLAIWITGNSNPFHQNIEEFVCDVAKEAGISSNDAEDAWEALGGRLSKD